VYGTYKYFSYDVIFNHKEHDNKFKKKKAYMSFAQFYTVAICTNVNQSQKWTIDPSMLASVHRTDV